MMGSVGGQRRGSEIQESGAHATGHATMWQTILECLGVCRRAWKVLRAAGQCAGAGVEAGRAPAAVWALVAAAEGVLNRLPRVYGAAEFVQLIFVVERLVPPVRAFESASLH